MNIIIVLIVVLISSFILFQIFMLVKSKRSVGNNVPYDKIDSEITDMIKDKKGLLYFHSPTCHSCKQLTPIVDKLKKEFDSVVSVDVTNKLETARAFNVMGTPSLLFVGANKIEGFYVGVKDEKFIREKLKGS